MHHSYNLPDPPGLCARARGKGEGERASERPSVDRGNGASERSIKAAADAVALRTGVPSRPFDRSPL